MPKSPVLPPPPAWSVPAITLVIPLKLLDPARITVPPPPTLKLVVPLSRMLEAMVRGLVFAQSHRSPPLTPAWIAPPVRLPLVAVGPTRMPPD